MSECEVGGGGGVGWRWGGGGGGVGFFFFKQKTAYEILAWLEFRRVLFRSIVLSTSRSRVAYSSYQVREMENVFSENQYPDVYDREELARVTGLSEHQVKVQI